VSPIHVHAGITEADYVIVIDPTLIHAAIGGLRPNAKIVATNAKSPRELRGILGLKEDVELWVVDGVKIAMETIGRAIANTAMLGAFAKATDEKIVRLQSLIDATEAVLGPRLPEEAVKKNIEAIKRAYDEVKKG